MKLNAAQTTELNKYLSANPKISREKAIKLLFGGGAIPSLVGVFR